MSYRARARQVDFNGDDTVDIADFFLLAENFGLVGMESDFRIGKRSRMTYDLERDHQGQLNVKRDLSVRGMSLLVGGDSFEDVTIEGSVWDRSDVVTRIWKRVNGLNIVVFWLMG